MDWSFGGTGSNPQPINAEHTVPQSFFRPGGQNDASEPMRSDLFHLFPSYNSWNSTRNNFPFDDIPDNLTTKWMILDDDQSSIPTSDIDGYSEFSNSGGYSRFEPREAHKGNVARAVFYFYTMYEDDNDVEEPIESVADVDLLIEWHMNDPVDEREIQRNERIEDYQGNRNPYIDHPDAVLAAWSNEPITNSIKTDLNNMIELFPNPTKNELQVSFTFAVSNARIDVYNAEGQLMLSNFIDSAVNHSISTAQLNNGIYYLRVTNAQHTLIGRFIKH